MGELYEVFFVFRRTEFACEEHRYPVGYIVSFEAAAHFLSPGE